MQGQQFQFPNRVSRRTVVKGLAAFAFAVSELGCASSPSPAANHPTPTAVPSPGTVLYSYKGHSDQVLAVAWSPDGKRIVSGSRDMTAQVWDALTGKHALIYRGHHNTVASLAWSPDSKYIASASWDKTVQVWNATTGDPIVTFRGHSGDVTSVSWSPDGKYIASGSADKTMRVWDASTGALLYIYRGHTAGVTAVQWSPDGSRIATGSTDRSVQICEAATGSHLYTYHGHSDEIAAVSWSPDSKHIASGSSDKSVQVWVASTGAVLYVYRGYNADKARTNPTKGVLPDVIYAVAWSHNSKRIAAVTQEYCGDDCGVVLTWDALTERHFTFYPTFPMFALAWSPDDRHFVVALAMGNGTAGGLSAVQITQAS